MARCRNDVLMSKIGMKKLTKLTEVDFSVYTDISSCVKAVTKNYKEVTAETASYNAHKRPDDLFNCLPEGCNNTGTLTLTGAVGEEVSAKFPILGDAFEFFAGLITYYVYLPATAGGKYTVTSSISDISETDSDVYTQTVTVTSEGFYPIVVDLSQVPTSETGAGWTASSNGINLEIAVRDDDALVAPIIGLSSIYVYDSIEDFEVNDIVKVGCVDEIGGDITVDPTDATCFGAEYDQNTIAVEKTVVGKSVTENYWKLNPLMRRGEKTVGWVPTTVELEVASTTIDGKSYGYVQLANMNLDECQFTSAQIADNCNVTDSTLRRVSSPIALNINEKQFIVLDGLTTAIEDAGKILFHESLIGQKVVISYPKIADVEHFEANENSMEGKRVRMTTTREQTDGTRVITIYNNVLITSFPDSISLEETTFEFTIKIERDKKGTDGNFFEVYRATE